MPRAAAYSMRPFFRSKKMALFDAGSRCLMPAGLSRLKMVRIGLMARRNFLTGRREFLGGLGAAAVGGLLPRKVGAAAGEAVLLQARIGKITLRPGQPETPVSMLVGPSPHLRFKRGASLDIALQNELSSPTVINWH